MRAYDPAAGEPAARAGARARGRGRPVRGVRRAPTCSPCSPSGTSSAGSTSTGCATAMRRRRASSTPATCSTRRRCAAAASPTRASAADARASSSPAAPASSVRTSADALLARGRRGRRGRQPPHRPARERRRTCADEPGFTFVEHDVIDEHPGRRARSTRCCTSRARRARPSTSRTRSRRSRSARSARATRSTSRREQRRAVPARVDERDLRRPARAPAAGDVLGQRQPDRPARGLRRGEAVRRGADDGVPPRATASTPRSCASSTPTARACARPTAGSCRTSSCRRCDGRAAHGLRRRHADPLVLLRRRRGARHPRAARLRPRRPGEHRQPERVHDARARRARARGHRLELRDRRSSRCPTDDPTQRRPDITLARELLGWEPTVAAPRRSRPHARLVPGGAGAVAERDLHGAVRSSGSSRSIVPVFNERNTVVEIVRRMRAVELPDGSTARSSSSTTAAPTAPATCCSQLGDSTVRVVTHAANRGKGAAIRTGLAHVHRRPRARSRTPTSSTTPRTGRKLLAPMLRGQGARRLRLALHRRAPQHAVPALGRQPVPVARHQRALQHDALRHGDLLQALRPARARRHHAARRPLRLRARDHREDPARRASASTRCRSPTPAASSTRARRSPGATASRRSWTLVKYRFVD